MTRDEILKMSAGRELNVEVAVHVMKHVGVFSDDVDDYSYDISAAWEVVEKMRTEHKQYITIIDNPHLNYDVRFSGSKSSEYHRLSNLPHAICRAALLAALEGKVEES